MKRKKEKYRKNREAGRKNSFFCSFSGYYVLWYIFARSALVHRWIVLKFGVEACKTSFYNLNGQFFVWISVEGDLSFELKINIGDLFLFFFAFLLFLLCFLFLIGTSLLYHLWRGFCTSYSLVELLLMGLMVPWFLPLIWGVFHVKLGVHSCGFMLKFLDHSHLQLLPLYYMYQFAPDRFK